MHPALVILLVVLGVACVGALAWWSWKQEEQRRNDLFALANDLGWSFDRRRDASHDDEYAHFEIFRKGHSRRAYNTLRGILDINGAAHHCKAGDFIYKVTQDNGKSSSTTTYRFSYLIIHLPYPALPDLLIRREGLFDKLAGALGFDDIDFESVEFSKRFCVKSNDKRFAYDVIDPRMMEFLLAGAPAAVDIERARLCLSDGTRRWEPRQFKSNITFAREFLDRWPDHVIASLQARR